VNIDAKPELFHKAKNRDSFALSFVE